MSPLKISHLFMVGLLVACGACMLAVGIDSTTDFCVLLSHADQDFATEYFTQTSNSSTNVPAKATVYMLSMGIFTIAVIPWLRYKEYPDYLSHVEERQRKEPMGRIIEFIISYDVSLLQAEIWNLLIYTTLFVFFGFLLGIDLSKPNYMMLAKPSYGNSDDYLECYSGLGAFKWFQKILITICAGFFTMIVIVLTNICKMCHQLSIHKKDMGREEEVQCNQCNNEVNSSSLLPQNQSNDIELQSVN